VIGSAEHYYRVILDRTISYIKKIVETKNFMNIESCHTLLYGLVQSLVAFLKVYCESTSHDQLKRILSITTVLIKRAANASEMFKLIQLGIFDLAAEVLRLFPMRVF